MSGLVREAVYELETVLEDKAGSGLDSAAEAGAGGRLFWASELAVLMALEELEVELSPLV